MPAAEDAQGEQARSSLFEQFAAGSLQVALARFECAAGDFPITQLPNYRAANACIIWGMNLRRR